MADAGGVVYLLSSYQSGKERWGHGEGGGGGGVRERYKRKGGRLTERGGEKKKGRGEHLVPAEATTFT